jgi:hypothetical protein
LKVLHESYDCWGRRGIASEGGFHEVVVVRGLKVDDGIQRWLITLASGTIELTCFMFLSIEGASLELQRTTELWKLHTIYD